MARKTYIIGNWKMHGTRASGQALANAIRSAAIRPNTEVVLCPPATLLSLVAPASFTPLGYDAGSVTTGVLTTPVVIAVAVALSSVLAGRSTVSDGFGILGLTSIGPIIAILIPLSRILPGAQ